MNMTNCIDDLNKNAIYFYHMSLMYSCELLYSNKYDHIQYCYQHVKHVETLFGMWTLRVSLSMAKVRDLYLAQINAAYPMR